MSGRVLVIGTGYVGLTTGACLSSLGHQVKCSDVDTGKIQRLSRGDTSLLEPGLADLVREGVGTGRLEFVLGSARAAADVDVVFLCVPTPMGADGAADLGAVESVVDEVRDRLPHGCLLVTKSTVPVGTTARLARRLGRADVHVVSNPEFLREGSAVRDFLQPDRIVIGSDSAEAVEGVAALYARIPAPIIRTGAASAELVKYVANCLLATRLSYVNALAERCERQRADIGDITEAMGRDHRIGPAFLRPGPGWGGSCLPKDAEALLRAAAAAGIDFSLLREAIATNTRQSARMVEKVATWCGAGPVNSLRGVRLGLLGLTFKAGTNDLRDSPAVAVARALAAEGAELVAYDPALSPDGTDLHEDVKLVDDPYLAAENAAGLVLLTEWPRFRSLDWQRLARCLERPVVVDTRNHLDPAALRRAGLCWRGLGRPAVEPADPRWSAGGSTPG